MDPNAKLVGGAYSDLPYLDGRPFIWFSPFHSLVPRANSSYSLGYTTIFVECTVTVIVVSP
jgi:hypothetical protein